MNGGLKWTGVRFLLLLGGGAIGLAATQGGKSCDGLCTGSLATAAFAVGVTLLADGIWDVATTARDLREVRRGYRSRCSSPC